MDKNGENRKLLTDEEGEAETFANCSPVSPVCVYQRGWKSADIYKISLITGEKTPLITFGQQMRPAISPDGKFVAYVVGTVDKAVNRTSTDIWIVPSAGGGFQARRRG